MSIFINKDMFKYHLSFILRLSILIGIILSSFLLLSVLFRGIFVRRAEAFTHIGGGVCECNSCADCVSALEDGVDCTSEVRLTTNISDHVGSCILTNATNASNKTFDCQDHTIDGDGTQMDTGIDFFSQASGNTIQNCIIRDFFYGTHLQTGNHTVQNSIFMYNQLGVYSSWASNNSVLDNEFYYNYQLSIGLLNVTSGNVSSNLVRKTDPGNGTSTFHIYQEMEDKSWEEVFSQPFGKQYETVRFPFFRTGDTLTLRIEQENRDFADIESIALSACGRKIEPSYAMYIGSGVSVLDEILEDDLFVALAHEQPIEISWDIPPFCHSFVYVDMRANEYNAGLPLLFPNISPEKYVSYEMGSNNGEVLVDGQITKEDEISNPQYTIFWEPTSGHPAGDNYLYIKDDSKNVYFSFDVTSDNTNEYGEDWIEIEAVSKDGALHKFRVDDFDDKYGRCSFGYSDKVSYKHQICELAVPKSEIGYDDFDFKVQYYGTASFAFEGTCILVENVQNGVINDNICSQNAGYGLLIQNLGEGGSTSSNSNILCSNELRDIYVYGTGDDTGDNNTCPTTFNWDDTGTTGCTNAIPCFGIEVLKTSNVHSVNSGEDVTYNYLVSNTGYVDLTGVTVTDDRCSPITQPQTTLDYGESFEATCTQTLTDTTRNFATVTATAPEGSSLQADDDLTVEVPLPVTGESIYVYMLLGGVIILFSVLFLGFTSERSGDTMK